MRRFEAEALSRARREGVGGGLVAGPRPRSGYPMAGGTAVLVHGGFVDGSGWEGVYRSLKKEGFSVMIVQNPTLSLADDVAVTKRALGVQDGPAVLVGHSYGGVVITEAGNHPNVAGLVYITAFAPDQGESVALLIKGPVPGASVSADHAPAGWIPVARQSEVSGVICG